MKINPYAKTAGVRTMDKRTGEEFNPKNFGSVNRSGGRSVSASENLFNSKNELNASTTAEALNKIKDILNMTASGEFDVEKQPIHVEAGQDTEAIISQAFSDPSSEGFRRAGQALVNPIKEVIDYESITAKLWTPRSVKAGEVIRYDKDVHVVGYVIADDGQTPQSQVEGKYVYPPEFEVTAYPSIELKDQYRAQYDILARAQDKARQAMEFQLDNAGMNLLQAGGNVVNNTTFFATLNVAAFEAMRYQIERHRLTCNAFVVNRQEISDVVNINTAVDPVTQRELIMAGYIGYILNAAIITTAGTNTYAVLNPGEVVAVTAPEYLGGWATRVEMTSEPVSEMHEGKPRRGWYWYMLTSLALINPAGVALGSKT